MSQYVYVVLLVELEKAKRALTQKYSFHSVGAFDAQAYNLEGIILFETLLITRAVDWLAKLSINPNSEIRRGTLSVFSELQAVYSTQKTLHELYFHHHDDKKLLETRTRGAMSDLGVRLARIAVAPAITSAAILKRQNIATELQNVSSLVEE